MRHQKKFNKLGRTSSHRKAMMANMASSLIIHKRISTTLAKAKALRTFIEPLITRSKEDTTHNRRVCFSYLKNKESVAELFREISTKVADRPGGYTRILKIGNRLGDNAEMCIIELVDYNEGLLAAKEDTKKAKTTRRRRPSKKTDDSVKATEPKAKASEEVAEVVVQEIEEVESTTETVNEPTETKLEADVEPKDDSEDTNETEKKE